MKQQSGHLHIQVELAGKLHANLPPTVVSLLENPEYKGGGLIALPESKYVKTPTAKEISQNAMWLLPLVNYSPSKAWFEIGANTILQELFICCRRDGKFDYGNGLLRLGAECIHDDGCFLRAGPGAGQEALPTAARGDTREACSLRSLQGKEVCGGFESPVEVVKDWRHG